MYKPHSKNTPSSQFLPYPKLSPQPSSNYTSKQNLESPKFDLKKFNDYLEDRLSRKVIRNEMEKSRRDRSQKFISQQISYTEIPNISNFQKDRGQQQFRDSRVEKSRDALSPKVAWRKHESIQKLLGKENKSILNENRITQSQSQQSALRQLQKKYQDLQQKYKKLLREASQNTRQFQMDKSQLNKMKQLHTQDQSTLSKLRKQLVTLNEDMNKKSTEVVPSNTSVFKCKSQQVIESDNSTIIGSLQPVHQMWKSKELKQQKSKVDYMKVSRNKTTQNWSKNMQRQNPFASQQKNKNKQSRYFSAEKFVQMSRMETKSKLSSDHNQYLNMESKISIKSKNKDSLRDSKVRMTPKPATQTLIRLENQFHKNTPSTLQKKVAGSNGYSKYRFKPTYKFE